MLIMNGANPKLVNKHGKTPHALIETNCKGKICYFI